MTLAQRLEERGMQRGLQQGELKGEQKGRHEIARKLLRRGGFDLTEIADISGLPLHEVELLDAEE